MSEYKNKSEEKKENSKDNNLIKLYPFNGRSPYLIDKFYIIGYSYLTLHKLLIKDLPKFIEEDNEKETKEPHKFNIEESPYILNEIISDYNKVGIPNETILSMIYPKKLDFYYTSEELGPINIKRANEKPSTNFKDFYKIDFRKDKTTPNFPKSFKVVFSSNPQSENNSKKSINGFAYIFYKKFCEKRVHDKKKYTFFIPYTFCITSEYPYFNSFYKLCKCIKNFYSQKAIYIPLEFLIYNIVSLSPSPLNSDVIIDLKSSLDQDSSFGNFNRVISNISNISNKEGNTEGTKDSLNINPFNTDMDLKKLSGIQKLRKSGFVVIGDDNNDFKKGKGLKKLSTQALNIFNNNNNYSVKKSGSEIQEIKFKLLSGYPLIQYNLSKVLLNNLTPEKVITIFLYTFLEKDVIFFSKDIEYLTLTLNAYLNLNFPLNDEKYYFIGAAISFEDFSYGNSEFGLKNSTSIIGINDQYRPDYKNKNLKIQDHLVIDLDKGEYYYGQDDNNNSVNERNKKIFRYIKRICDGYEDDKVKNTTFYQAIKNLHRRLKGIYDSIYENSLKKNMININSKYLDYTDGDDAPVFNFYRSVTLTNNNINNYHNINKKNREIQEAFYEFVHNICLYFYENLSIKAQEDDQYKIKNNTQSKDGKNEANMNVIFNKNYAKESERTYTEEELIFLDELTDTMKFQSFVFVFLQSYNPIDLYKIPLTFTEEFLSIISRKKEQIDQNVKKIDFFNLIDSLYISDKRSEKKSVNFDVLNFNYFKKYKSIFDREIYDRSKTKYFPDNRHLIKFISGKTDQILNEGNVNQRILIYQSYELDDNLLLKYLHMTKNLNKTEYLGEFYGSFYVEENLLKDINITEIESRIENHCIEKELLSNSDICCANIILLFTLSLKSLRETVDCQTFLGILFQDFTVFRKYYSILIRMIYRLYQQQKNYASTLCYYPCINSIRTKKLVPNEALMNMINLFNKINVGELHEQEENKNEALKDEKFKDVKLYGEQLEEIPINESNLYVYHNFCSERFVSEKEIVEHINKVNQTDNIEINLKTGEKVFPRIRFNNGIHKIESFFLSQKILLENLCKEYNKYIEDLDDNKLAAKLILDACLNVFIFMRNQSQYVGKDDIFEVLQSIFYIFMNQLFILKSIKEKKTNI